MYGARDCASCTGEEGCPPRRLVLDTALDACPTRLRRSSAWQAVVLAHNAVQVSPLSGWHDSYVLWFVEALSALQDAMTRAAIERAKQK